MASTFQVARGPRRSIIPAAVPSFLRDYDRPFKRTPAPHARAGNIQPRHVEIIRLIGEFSYSNKEIAEAMGTTRGTVSQYVQQILTLLGFNNRNEIFAYYQSQQPQRAPYPLMDNNVRLGAYE